MRREYKCLKTFIEFGEKIARDVNWKVCYTYLRWKENDGLTTDIFKY